ncbi:MAG: TIGR03009 domain-containing protein [Gemmataceae bacterium]
MFPTDCVPAVLAAVASVVGQMQPLPGVSPAVQTHLRAWERASAGVKTFTAEFTKVVEDRIISRQTTYTGSVWLKKPNLARLRVEHQPAPEQKRDPDAYEAYICDGNEAFVYVGGTRTVTVYPLAGLPAAANNPLFNFIVRMDPQNWPFVGPENLLTLAAGGRVNAAQLVRRFDIREVPDKKGGPYLYLEFVPRTAADKALFDVATVALIRPGQFGDRTLEYMPRVVRFVRRNGQEVETWDFPSPQVNTALIDRRVFRFINPGAGWKIVRVPAAEPANPKKGAGDKPKP